MIITVEHYLNSAPLYVDAFLSNMWKQYSCVHRTACMPFHVRLPSLHSSSSFPAVVAAAAAAAVRSASRLFMRLADRMSSPAISSYTRSIDYFAQIFVENSREPIKIRARVIYLHDLIYNTRIILLFVKKMKLDKNVLQLSPDSTIRVDGPS